MNDTAQNNESLIKELKNDLISVIKLVCNEDGISLTGYIDWLTNWKYVLDVVPDYHRLFNNAEDALVFLDKHQQAISILVMQYTGWSQEQPHIAAVSNKMLFLYVGIRVAILGTEFGDFWD